MSHSKMIFHERQLFVEGMENVPEKTWEMIGKSRISAPFSFVTECANETLTGNRSSLIHPSHNHPVSSRAVHTTMQVMSFSYRSGRTSERRKWDSEDPFWSQSIKKLEYFHSETPWDFNAQQCPEFTQHDARNKKASRSLYRWARWEDNVPGWFELTGRLEQIKSSLSAAVASISAWTADATSRRIFDNSRRLHWAPLLSAKGRSLRLSWT